MAEEGIFEKDDVDDVKQKRNNPSTRPSVDDQRPTKAKKARLSDKSGSILEQEGVNMRAVDDGTQKDMSTIFPSYRGRGRGGKP